MRSANGKGVMLMEPSSPRVPSWDELAERAKTMKVKRLVSASTTKRVQRLRLVASR